MWVSSWALMHRVVHRTGPNNRLTTIKTTQWHNSSMYMWEIMFFSFFFFSPPFLLSHSDCGRSGSCSCSGFWVSAAWQNLRGMLRFDFCHSHCAPDHIIWQTVFTHPAPALENLQSVTWVNLVKGDTRLYIETCKHDFRENLLLQNAYYVLC